MSDLFLAHKKGLDLDVVIKRVHRQLRRDIDQRNEADVLKTLKHQYLPRIYDVIQGPEGDVYTVMEYVRGENLQQYVQKNGPLGQKQAHKWGCQLCEAVQYLHEEKNDKQVIYHLDIKPSNIMITDSGDICLIDFGTSLICRGQQIASSFLTHGYAAPEQYGNVVIHSVEVPPQTCSHSVAQPGNEGETLPAAGSASVNRGPAVSDGEATLPVQNASQQPYLNAARASRSGTAGGTWAAERKAGISKATDVYAIGATLYYAVTGHKPEPSIGQLTPLDAWHPKISRPMAEIIQRAMQKDPDLRYQSASEMLRDIDEFKRNPSVIFEYKYFTDEASTRYFDAPNPEEEEGDGKKKKGKKEKGKTKDGKKKKRMSTSMQILLAVTGACVLVAIVALIIFFTALNQPPGSFRLYNLVGLNYNEVLDDPAYDQIELEISSTEPSDEYDEGIIIEQDPRANTSVRQGSVVRVVVSSGLRLYPVPDVSGLNQEQAEQEITDAGFVPTVVQQSDDTVPAGQVISTSPAANEEAKKGSTVTIYLSTGSRNLTTLTTVPRVVGMTRSQAEQELANFDLTASFTEVDSTQPAGRVISQNYDEGTRVAEGTTVILEISSGNAPQKTVNCSVSVGDTSQYASRDYTVSVTVDGSSAGSFTFNPASSSTAGYDVSGRSTSSTVTFTIDGQTFARFTVNFQTGSVSNTSVNTDLLETAAASTPTSSSPSSSTSSGSGTSSSTSSGSDTSSTTSETEE